MNPSQLTGKQPKTINLKTGIFESNQNWYFVHPEGMGYKRLKRFYESLPVIVFGRKFTELATVIHDLRMKMTSGGDDFKRTYFDVASELMNLDQAVLDNANDLGETIIDDVLRCCACFIVRKDEDLTDLDDRLTEEKINDWKSDMVITDFFFVLINVLPKYKALLTTLSQEAKLKGGKLRGSIPTN